MVKIAGQSLATSDRQVHAHSGQAENSMGVVDVGVVDVNAIDAHSYCENRDSILEAFKAIRSHSLRLSAPFSNEEQQIQSMADASPVKWHLAHTSWFFESFFLGRNKPDFEWYDQKFNYLFNSYYNAIGRQYPRSERGLMSRPGVDRIMDYRQHVDRHMVDFLETCSNDDLGRVSPLLVLGMNHEQQHQELIITDIKHALSAVYQDPDESPRQTSLESNNPASWFEYEDTRTIIGYQETGFCFDNELAAHEILIPAFRLATRQVSNAEWLAFMEDGGYENPLLWLSDGWAWKCNNRIKAPLYWQYIENCWFSFSPAGLHPILPNKPVRHVSYYEADAYAAWAQARLPRESEWELSIRHSGWITNAVSPHEDAAEPPSKSELGDIGRNWEWTQSAYSAYPGFRGTPGIAAEYNGKFMINQMVLRGASSATSACHSRPSYRNFFHPHARWQFTSVRLAQDMD
jgi:ergothioneine biosynthesis protein EgtB